MSLRVDFALRKDQTTCFTNRASDPLTTNPAWWTVSGGGSAAGPVSYQDNSITVNGTHALDFGFLLPQAGDFSMMFAFQLVAGFLSVWGTGGNGGSGFCLDSIENSGGKSQYVWRFYGAAPSGDNSIAWANDDDVALDHSHIVPANLGWQIHMITRNGTTKKGVYYRSGSCAPMRGAFKSWVPGNASSSQRGGRLVIGAQAYNGASLADAFKVAAFKYWDEELAPANAVAQMNLLRAELVARELPML